MNENYPEWRDSLRIQLDGFNIGHGGQEKFQSLFLIEPFVITRNELETVKQQGVALTEWIRTSNQIYQKALLDDSQFSWLLPLFHHTRILDIIESQKIVFSRETEIGLPMLIRLDQLDFTTNSIAEMQTPGSGWGYMLAIEKAYKTVFENDYHFIGDGLDKEYIRLVSKNLNVSRPEIDHVLHKEFYKKEANFFAQQVKNSGVNFFILYREFSKRKNVNLIIRHYMEQFIQYNGWKDVIHNGIVIDPPPSIVTDQKVAQALPFDSRTSKYYSDKVRELFPETYFLSNMGNNIEGEWIVKYGGLDPFKRAASKAVYKLSDLKKKGELRNFFEQARLGVPWLIQRCIKKRFSIIYVKADGKFKRTERFARLNPVFGLSNGSYKLISFIGNWGHSWIVQGGREIVCGPIVVKKD